MPTLPNQEVQAQILRQIVEANDAKRKLEDSIKAVDSRNRSMMESAAKKDIEAYKRHM